MDLSLNGQPIKKHSSVKELFNLDDSAPRFHIFGTGGIAVVLVEVMYDMGFRLGKVFDDDCSAGSFHDVKIDSGIELRNTHAQATKPAEGTDISLANHPLFICVGNNQTRKELADLLSSRYDRRSIVAKHSSALVSPSATVGNGTMIFHGSCIQASASIGRHVIVNTAATIDHDCEIGDFVHIAPQVGLSGGVVVGEGTEIGVGASVLPNTRIGRWSRIGGGATVINDIPDNAIAVGTPARVIKLNGQRVD